MRILARDAGGTLRKIIKVIRFSNGGFAIAAPYHRARSGTLAKMPVDYARIGAFDVSRDEWVEYSASDRVKLSYHPDGFVQFSGENPGKVLSGRDADTGAPKGLGLMCQSLDEPVNTGPTFAVTAWGLGDFDVAKEEYEPDNVRFEREDLYFRNCTPETANALAVEGFLLPMRMMAGVRDTARGLVLSMAHRFFEGTGAVLEWRVMLLNPSPVILAICASHIAVSFPAPSGFYLGGPGEKDPDGNGRVLVAFYPDLGGRGTNLDYRPGRSDQR